MQAQKQAKQPKRSRAQKRQFSQAFPNGRKNQNPRPAKRQRRRRGQMAPANLGPSFSSMNLTGRGSTRNSQNSSRETVLHADEYIQEVTVANQPNFNNVQLAVNPGQAATFPWLAPIAARFEKYRFRYLEFYYKREVSEFATNGTVGKVMMSFDTDASDAPPATKQQLEDTDPHVDGLPSENLSLIIQPRMLNSQYDAHYVRPGAQPAGSDIKTYDVGNLNLATILIANNVAVGELHVRYEVVLSIPVLENQLAQAPKSSAFFQSLFVEASGATGVTTQLTMSSATVNGLGVVNTAGSFVPPPGNYLLTYSDRTVDSIAGDLTQSTVILQKNGVNVVVTPPDFVDTAAGANLQWYMSQSVIVAANGTDAFTVSVNNVFTGGTCSNAGTITFTAI